MSTVPRISPYVSGSLLGGCYIASQRSDGVELITGDIITNDIITVLYLIAHKIVRLGVLGLINLIYATVSVKVIDNCKSKIIN